MWIFTAVSMIYTSHVLLNYITMLQRCRRGRLSPSRACATKRGSNKDRNICEELNLNQNLKFSKLVCSALRPRLFKWHFYVILAALFWKSPLLIQSTFIWIEGYYVSSTYLTKCYENMPFLVLNFKQKKMFRRWFEPMSAGSWAG